MQAMQNAPAMNNVIDIRHLLGVKAALEANGFHCPVCGTAMYEARGGALLICPACLPEWTALLQLITAGIVDRREH